MYKLQPLFKSAAETPLPSCVYQMKKISDHFNHNNAGSDGTETQNGVASADPDVVELEKRWTEITSRLQRLQLDIAAVRSTSCNESLPSSEALGRNFQDVVIRANPSRPPHSLPLLKQRMDKLGLKVFAKTHVHSTVDGQVADALKDFVRSDPQLERSQSQLAITLIWTKAVGEEPTLMVSPSSQRIAIQGEANILRYIARTVPGLLDYERDPIRAARLDQWLDLTDPASPLGSRGAKKDRITTLQSLEKTLSTSKALDGELGPVDFIVYSSLMNSASELGQNTRAWMDRCRSSGSSKRAVLEKYLTQLGITFRTLEHPAVFTVAAMMEHVSSLAGLHAKNLLVKDKKSGKLFLITARHDAAVQLNAMAKLIGAKELRFADTETLEATLAVQQGSVTPFALLNDVQHVVNFVLDRQLWDADMLNFHPLTNEATTSISSSDFKTFLKATGHEPILVQL